MTSETDNILDGITEDQRRAIEHIDSHARLLAGPGTGKTHVLTKKVLWLVLKHGVDPKDIIALTFTRLAAAQLRAKLKEVLEPHDRQTPNVSTLHSFALRQILFNSRSVKELPSPVRVADDWEERHIIQEDIKRILELKRIDEVQNLINRLSTDWETLKAEEGGWQENFPDPRFLGALEQHKGVYGETLRAELVYRLKRALDQSGEFKLDHAYKYILIDEYQDLNACDLAVVRLLSENGDGAKLFVVGDDDQSIYGFRFADPVGIRRFPEDYGAERLDLETCFRCDKEILRHAEFVASQDIQRLPKKTRPRDNAADGKVVLIRFADQDKEAAGVAGKIKQLIDSGTKPEQIVILSRSKKILEPIKEQLKVHDVNVSGSLESELEMTKPFRCVISLLRLVANETDDLALRTLLQCDDNDIGEVKIDAIWKYAAAKNIRISEALMQIQADPAIIPTHGAKIKAYMDKITAMVKELRQVKPLGSLIEMVTSEYCAAGDLGQKIDSYFKGLVSGEESQKLEDLLKAVSTSSEMIEQETEKDAVSVLTMHQAKGLTFEVCFIVGAEDEFIPGRNDGETMGDERRLLYVSMTRAKHELYISYCDHRTGGQKFMGRVSEYGQERRSLTRFLRDAKIEIVVVK